MHGVIEYSIFDYWCKKRLDIPCALLRKRLVPCFLQCVLFCMLINVFVGGYTIRPYDLLLKQLKLTNFGKLVHVYNYTIIQLQFNNNNHIYINSYTSLLSTFVDHN